MVSRLFDARSLGFEADAGNVRQPDIAILDRDAVGEAAEGLEHVGIRLVAAEMEPGGDVERHLMSAMGHDAPARPALLRQHLERAQILDQPVGERAVELQEVAIGAHAAIAQQVARILMREQVLAGGGGALVAAAQFGLEGIVERIARLLVPEQAIGRERLGIGERGVEIEAAIGIDGEILAVAHHLEHGLDAAQILGERRAADLHLDDAIAAVAIAFHLRLERRQVLARLVVAAGGIDPDLVVGLAAAIAVGEQAVERLALDLRHRVPDGHVDGADRDRAIAVAARLLVAHHRRPDAEGIEVVLRRVDQRVGRCSTEVVIFEKST